MFGKPTPKSSAPATSTKSEPARTPSPAEQQLAALDAPDAPESAESEFDLGDAPSDEPALDAAQTEEAPDWSWAEPFSAYREGIHGIATTELLQALSEGSIPDALMDKLTLTMRDGDHEWTGTVADLRNGAQMQANFTRKSQAFAQEKKAFETERSELIEHFRGWREDETGESTLAGLEKFLGEEAVMRAAKKLAERLDRKAALEELEASGQVPPGTAKAVLERDQLLREKAELERYKKRAEHQTNEQEAVSVGKQQGAQIRNEALNQFKRIGVEQKDLSPGMWNLFKDEIQAIWNESGKAPGPAEIRMAVMAAKQRSDAYLQAHEQKQAAQKRTQPAISSAAPAGAPAAPKKPVSSAASRKQPMSTDQFRKQFMGGRK